MTEKMNAIMNEAESHLIKVYNRFPVVFESGKGMYLYDADGKEYLDFASGIGVNAFGYGDAELEEALCGQVRKLMHTSNLYYHEPLAEAGKALSDISGMPKIFFTNSGAEAIEGALKTAKRYYFNRTGKNDAEVIAMESSFHGRTIGAVSVTGTDAYRSPFYPLMDGVRFAKFNDISSVEALVSERTCAVIMEPVQGEGGIHPAGQSFIEGVRKLCDEKNILLIFDEIQCGMGRTGAFYAFQNYNVTPDILTTAKALGAGVPVGAFAVTEKVAENSLKPGDHGSTYGGNPFCMKAVATSIRLMKERNLPAHVKEITPYFEEVLDSIVSECTSVKGRRGCGFMQGLILDQGTKAGEVAAKALEKGLIVLTAEGNVLRLLPPLICDREDIDKMKNILVTVL